MIDYQPLLTALAETPLGALAHALPSRLNRALARARHADLQYWLGCIAQLPRLESLELHLDRPCVAVGSASSSTNRQRERMYDLLQALHPWRKGPFSLHGLHIDAEWRCDRKWHRLERGIAPLDGRLILDVGSGNGYYAWRMVGAGARLVLGVDPSLRVVCQYLALRHFFGDQGAFVLPLAFEELPQPVAGFDTLFSMGVLYHRRSPLDHLLGLRRWLRPGGELVLETLVAGQGENRALVPRDRYAQMRNVWFIPSPESLLTWLRRCGFRRPRLVDVTATTSEEQRSTDWMRFHSLRDFLDPEQPSRTVEGLPAPVRAIVVAEA